MTQTGFDISRVVAECVSESAGRAFSRRIALDHGFSATVEAFGDRQAVKRIVTNLLSNALLYTQEGGHVRLEIHDEEGAVGLSVSDNGTGFSRAEAAAAGEAFCRYRP